MKSLAATLAGLFAAATLAPAAAVPARDEIRDQQWHLDALQVDQAHTISEGAGITVGVIDTGVDASHPDLAGSVIEGYDYVGLQPTQGREDRDGHGTAMAGLIAAHGRATGVAPAAKILPMRTTFTDNIGGSFESAAIDWAVDHGATVLCLAFAGDSDDLALHEAVNRAAERNVVVVAGIGNEPHRAEIFPGAYPSVVTAAGTDRAGNHASISLTGPQAVLAAPAVEITSTGPIGLYPSGYRIGTGTSDSTAIIAGVAALVRAKFPDLSAAEVIHRMTATADDKGPPGRDDEYGYGIVNPVKALTADVPPLTPSTEPTPTQAIPPRADNSGPNPALIVGLVGVGALLTVGLILAMRRRKI
jgi:type VII secretion-associated serine protease mycosin